MKLGLESVWILEKPKDYTLHISRQSFSPPLTYLFLGSQIRMKVAGHQNRYLLYYHPHISLRQTLYQLIDNRNSQQNSEEVFGEVNIVIKSTYLDTVSIPIESECEGKRGHEYRQTIKAITGLLESNSILSGSSLNYMANFY